MCEENVKLNVENDSKKYSAEILTPSMNVSVTGLNDTADTNIATVSCNEEDLKMKVSKVKWYDLLNLLIALGFVLFGLSIFFGYQIIKKVGLDNGFSYFCCIGMFFVSIAVITIEWKSNYQRKKYIINLISSLIDADEISVNRLNMIKDLVEEL